MYGKTDSPEYFRSLLVTEMKVSHFQGREIHQGSRGSIFALCRIRDVLCRGSSITVVFFRDAVFGRFLQKGFHTLFPGGSILQASQMIAEGLEGSIN